MAKKRKFNPKSTETSSTQQKKQQKQQQKKQEDEEEQRINEEHVEEEEVEEEEEAEFEEENNDEDGEEEEVEEEVEEEEEEDDDGAEPATAIEGDEDEEPILKLLEPFSKDQLIGILTKAAESHPDVVARIRKIADEDTVHRKIFVHGLGWDTTADTLRSAFSQYGEIEDCKAVTDKVSGKSKGYGFILFKSRTGARKALKEPQKKIGNRMTACQLAAVGPGPGPGPASSSTPVAPQTPQSEYTQRKIYVSNVAADLDPQKLTAYFAKYGEIEEGPLGLDKQTGRPKGFCLFVYRSVESARRALEEPHKQFEGHVLHCQKAIDGPKPGKQHQMQPRGQQYGRNDNPNLVGAIGGPPATGAGLMGQSVAGVPFNHGAAAGPALNPALGQALSALLATQGAGLGLNNLLGTLGGGIGAPGVGAAGHGMQGGYGSQAIGGINPGLSGYANQAGLQAAYPNQQMGQGGSGRSQHGHMGGVAPYGGH